MCHLPGHHRPSAHQVLLWPALTLFPCLDKGKGWRWGRWGHYSRGKRTIGLLWLLCHSKGQPLLQHLPSFPALPLFPWDPHPETQTLLHAYTLSLFSALPSASCHHRSLLFPLCFYVPHILPSRQRPSTAAPKALLPTFIFTCFHWNKWHLSKKFSTSDDS